MYEDQSDEAGKIARSRQFTGQINPTLLTVSSLFCSKSRSYESIESLASLSILLQKAIFDSRKSTSHWKYRKLIGRIVVLPSVGRDQDPLHWFLPFDVIESSRGTRRIYQIRRTPKLTPVAFIPKV